MTRDTRKMIEAELGGIAFDVKAGGKHEKIMVGGRVICTVARTPSCHRAMKNTRARIRQFVRSAAMAS